MSDFLHGVNIKEIETNSVVSTSSSSVIGIIGTAPNADADMYPFNTPVLTTGASAELLMLGSSGTIPQAIDAILSQTGAMVVIVRVEEADEEELEFNILGDADEYTGVYAFLLAKTKLGVTPRILIAPNFCTTNIVTELIPISERLNGVVVIDTPLESNEKIIEYIKACASSRVYAVYPSVQSTKGDTVPASPYVAGVIARTDKENGFWCSPSNKVINGIIGLSNNVDFALGDTACKANYLNMNHVATIINQDGFRLWGNRSTATSGKHMFLCVRRTADIISDSILRAHLWAVDRNIVKNYLTDVTESVNAFLSTLRSNGAILSGKCYANKELNTGTSVAEGKIYFDFEFTPAYPAEQVMFRAYLNNSNIESILLENLA